MGFEKAAYRGGGSSLPEPPEARYAYDRRCHDPPISPAWFDHWPADGDCPRRGAAYADGGVEGASRRLCRPVFFGPARRWPPARCSAWFRTRARYPDRDRAIEVRRQKVRDRSTDVPAGAKVGFTSNILPKSARRSKSLAALLAVFYPRGISIGDVQEALSAFPGTDAPNL